MVALAPSPAVDGPRDPVHLFNNHGLVLLYVATHPVARERDIAAAVGIAERSTGRIVADLSAAGYLDLHRVGRRNVYRVNTEAPLRNPQLGDRTVADLLAFLGAGSGGAEVPPRNADEQRPPGI